MSGTRSPEKGGAHTSDHKKEEPHVFVRGEDGKTYVIRPEVLKAFLLNDVVMLTVAGKQYAIPKAVVELEPLSADANPGIDEALDKQELPEEKHTMMSSPWNILPYTGCFYGAWAGGGDAVAAADYCEARYPFS